MKSIRLDFPLIKTFWSYSRYTHREIIKREREDRISITRCLEKLEKKFISNVRSILLSISEFKTRQAYPGGQRFREPEAH